VGSAGVVGVIPFKVGFWFDRTDWLY
jgi:hypothetical protein